MRQVRGTDNDYLLLPYLTRFNSAKRVVPVHDGFETALLTVGDAHQDAVVVILTTDSNRFDWLGAAVSSLYESKSRLISLLSTDYRLNYRPDNLSMLEFTESRLPHVQVEWNGHVGTRRSVESYQILVRHQGYLLASVERRYLRATTNTSSGGINTRTPAVITRFHSMRPSDPTP